MAAPHPRALPIRLRVALAYALFLVASIAIVGIYLLAALESNLRQDADDTLRLRAQHVGREIVAAWNGRLDPRVASAVLANLTPTEELSESGTYVQVLGSSGGVLAASPDPPGRQLPSPLGLVSGALSGREGYADVPMGNDRVRVFALPLVWQEQVIGAVIVGESMHTVDATLRRLRQLLVAAAAGAGILSLVGGWWLTTRTLGPVAEVTRVARRIAATGRFEQRITLPPTRDELGELAVTFNEMLDRLEKGFRRQGEFLADASHELRGPLMVIRGNLDLLKLTTDEGEQQECARDIGEEVERMSRLVSDLLFLSEVDAQEMVEHLPVALDEVVSAISERAKELDAGSHEIALARNDPATVRGDRHRLEQMLGNLVENALRYTPPPGRVAISLRNHGDIAELAVADDGVGITPEHLPRIFDRFYRVDRGRSRADGGSGLGLAIVKQVAEAHGGQVRVRSTSGEGTVFTVALPLRQP